MESLTCDKNSSHTASEPCGFKSRSGTYDGWRSWTQPGSRPPEWPQAQVFNTSPSSWSLFLGVCNSPVYRKVPGWRRLQQGLSQLFLCRDLNFHVTLAARF